MRRSPCKVKVLPAGKGYGGGWQVGIKTPSDPIFGFMMRVFKTKREAQEAGRRWCRNRGYRG